MLVTVLKCYQPEEVKWKDLSGQIIDLLLPLLANKQVKSFIVRFSYIHVGINLVASLGIL